MTYLEIVKAWNDLADDMNQWDALGEDEKIEFAFKLGLSKKFKPWLKVF